MNTVFHHFFTHRSIQLYIFLFFGAIITAFILSPARFTQGLWPILIPILLAPFFEWFAHKYLLHRLTDPLKNPRAHNYMLKLHYQHHWEPGDLHHVFAPISSAFFVFLIFAPVALLTFNLQEFFIFEAGVIGYFLFYEWIHLAHHLPTYRARTRWGKLMRKAHSWHHFKNESFWWGVTNPLGDFLFGTFKEPKEVEASPGARSLGELQKKKKGA